MRAFEELGVGSKTLFDRTGNVKRIALEFQTLAVLNAGMDESIKCKGQKKKKKKKKKK